MRGILGRDGRCNALIAVLVVAGGACGGGGVSGPIDAATDGDGGDDIEEDASGVDIPPPICADPVGDVVNAACSVVTADGPCVQPLMVDDNSPAPAGGTLVAGTYDLSERTVFTSPGGATGPAGEPLKKTIVVSGSGTSLSIDEAVLSAAIPSRRTLALELVGASGQLRVTVTCPSPDPTDGGTNAPDAGSAGTTPSHYTAGDGTLTLHRLGAVGPIESETYAAR
jgi:hypothetical protein